MSRGRPGGGMPVVEMLINKGLEALEIVEVEAGLGTVGDKRAERIVFEASRQIVLSWIPMGASGLGCR